MKHLILLAALLPMAVWAESNLCTVKEQTIVSRDEKGQQLVTKRSETTCLDHNGVYKNFGVAPVCGQPSKLTGHINTLSCILPDGSWKAFDINPNVDKFAETPKKDVFLLDFSDYGSGGREDIWIGKLMSFFRKLNSEQEAAYQTSIHTALNQAETGQKVTWRNADASGYVVPVATIPSSQGFCRILQVSVNAYNTNSVDSRMACYSNFDGQWRWVRDK